MSHLSLLNASAYLPAIVQREDSCVNMIFQTKRQNVRDRFFFFKATSKWARHRLYTWRSDYSAWTKWYNARCESEVWENKITHHLNIRDYLSITGSQIHSQVLRSKTWAFVRRRESDERWYQVALWGKEVFFRSLTHAREWKSGCVSAVCSLFVWMCTITLLEGALKGAICKKTFNK